MQLIYKLGEYEKAKRFIKASIDLNEQEASAEVLEHLGDVHDKLNNPEEAKKWWKRALEKDPSLNYLQEKIQE
jgi:tetratricopeptide (TPR) repeat protein